MGDPAFWAPVVPWVIPAGILGTWALAWWGLLYPRFLVWLLAITVVAGQLVRLPLPGQGGGLLPSDVVAFILLCVLGIKFLQVKIKPEILLLASLLITYLAYALGRAFLGIGSLLTSQDFLVVFAYWLRLATYILLIPLLMHAGSTSEALAATIKKSFLAVVSSLALLGIIQLVFLPNLAMLGLPGWDPHEHRLVSTWLDPNLLGLLFVVAIPFVATLWLKTKEKKYGAMLALLLVALLGTASRSSFIAAFASIMAVCWAGTLLYRHRISQPMAMTLLTMQLFVGICAAVAIVLFPVRFSGLVTSDATVSLRQEALTQAVVRLGEPHAITGVGYNAYQFVAQEEGIGGDFTIHSRAGADNSLVTLWVTTGAIGLLLAGLCSTAMWLVITHRKQPWVVWVTATTIAAIIIHSQFVNSALYGHILLSLALLVASLYSTEPSKEAYAH